MNCGEGIIQDTSVKAGVVLWEKDSHILDYMLLKPLTHFYVCLVDEGRMDQPLHQRILTNISILIGLFGLMVFIFDGVNLVSQRRIAQIVANEAAIAGAHAFCGDGDVSAMVHDQVITNPSIHLEGLYLDQIHGEITVETSLDFNTFILEFLGGPSLNLSARAKATCSTR